VSEQVRHVALNAAFLDPGKSGGPETYLRGLVPAMARQFPGLRLTVLTTRRGAARLVEDGWRDIATVVALPTDEGERSRRLAAELVLASDAAGRRGADLLHSLASVGPVVAGLPTVVTVHDVTFLHMRTFGRSTTLAMAALMTGAAHRADGLLSPSAAARDDICAMLRLDPARVAVVPHGRGRPSSGRALGDADVRQRLDLEPEARVVLCVAAVRPHKNQALLAHALTHLPDNAVVVCCGHQEPYVEEVHALAAELGVADRLRLPGSLEDDVLEGLWRLAACVALPTLGEGFGFPVLEALDRGLPLACSDLAVLREVGGALPRYFDPRDGRSAAAAIRGALADPPLAEEARAQAGRFSWAAAARGTYNVYERALTG